MKSIAVYCGSSPGSNPVYMERAAALGRELAARGIGLIYGGANIGLMGAVANGAIHAGGRVIGVLPHFLSTKEIAHKGLTELILVDNMHERKMKMNELCEGVIALPGGFGTLEELFEMLTWAQLGLHSKPIGVLNVNGYYDSLFQLVHEMVENGFLKQINQEMLLVSKEIPDLLSIMKSYKAPDVPKWIDNSKT